MLVVDAFLFLFCKFLLCNKCIYIVHVHCMLHIKIKVINIVDKNNLCDFISKWFFFVILKLTHYYSMNILLSYRITGISCRFKVLTLLPINSYTLPIQWFYSSSD